MALWDEVPAGARSSGVLEQLRPLLESLSTPTSTEETDADGTWQTFGIDHTAAQPLTFGPGAGGFGSSAGSSSTPVEIGRTTRLELGLHLTSGSPDGGWRFTLTAPDARVRLPFLRGAELDAQGQLRANGQPVVFTLPSLRLRVKQLNGQAAVPQLLSASTSGSGTDALYDFLRMDPPYALVGPSDVVGFAFRTAVLDLSGTAGPGVPAGARAMPADWQGFWLPEARLFVAPSGLEGIAVSAGVRDLWIGLGVHAGVTGTFEAEVVNRGATPTISVGFRTPSGRYLPDPGPAPAPALVPEQVTLVVDAAGGIAPVSVSISVDGSTTDSDRVDLTVPSGTTRTVVITARDGSANPPATRTLTVQHDPGAAAGSGSPLDAITVVPTSTTSYTVTRVPSAADELVLRLEPQVPAVWTWPGGGSGSPAETVTVPVTAGQTLDVQAVVPPTQPQTIDAYFLFAQPGPFNGNSEAERRWAENGSNMRVGKASSRDVPGDPRTVRDALPARLAEIGAGTELRVTGYASWEGSQHDTAQHATYNQELSERRRDALVRLLRKEHFTNVVSEPCHGFTAARDGTAIDPGPPPAPGDPAWWRARATTVGHGSTTCTARVARVAVPEQREVDRQPPAARRPDCFRRIGVRVELLRGTFIRAEVYGEFDIETAVEGSLARRGQPALRSGARPNPLDGVCRFLVRLRIAEDRDSWLVSAEFRAAEGDLDGLAEMTRAGANTTAIDVLGAVSVLAPLSSAAAELSPAAGALVALGTVTLGASTLIQVQRIVLRGGELVVSQGTIAPDGSATADPHGNAVSVLLDVEVVFSFDLGIVRVDPATPVSTRYQAIGVRTSWNTAGSSSAPEFLPIPVFDPSRGYSLDIPAGAVTASPPMDEVLRVLGIRVSRDNPTFLEVEVGMGLDLGIVKVDTVRVRARLDPPPLDITLTKLGASLEIPGTLHGSGSLEFTPLGFKGSFDLTIIPTNIRGRATLSVETDADGVTGVLVGADIEFPVPLLLGASGLGIFGFLGGVGINYQRNETPYAGSQVPALGWLTDQLARGHVMDGAGWTHTAGAYAVAAGVLLGTVEGGFVAHLKGIVLIEVPGPRLLLVMKADVLKTPPVLKDASATATFLAVLDIDFGRGTITLGIVASYEIQQLLRIRVPVTGFFSTGSPDDWFIDLGSYTDRVTVEVLDVISGSGYLMVHGNGLEIPGLPEVTSGLAIATGFHISAVLMGSKAASLYLEVAAGFDAILGFDPFFLAGTIYARGELRLFVISIAASAELTVIVGRLPDSDDDITYVHGEVCGKVELFFFDIEGCVELTIGEVPPETLTPPPLVAGVSLVSRSPALVEGSGSERAIDAKLADAVEVPGDAALPSVPLDAIPVVLFRTGPRVQPGSVLGVTPLGNPGTQEWVRLGDRWWAYELTGVTLSGPLQPTSGKTPSSWWKQGAPTDPAVGPALALLNWLPTPFSRALPYGESLTTTVEDRWGTVCSPPAPPAPVLWTFDGKPLGPSRVGWELQGVPWPDPPGTVRTQPVHAPLAVSEPWRCGDLSADALQGTTPAAVVGDAVPCKASQRVADDPLEVWMAEAGAAMSNRVVSTQGEAAWEAVAQALAAGVSLSDVSATRRASGWEPGLRDDDDCDGRILRAPLGDSLEPAPRGTTDDQDRVRAAWAQTGHAPVELRDAVRIVPVSGASELALLLLVPEEIFVDRLVVRFLKEDGSLQHEHRLSGGDRVGGGRTIPSAWFDPAGPWAEPVSRAGLAAGRIAAAAGHPQVLVLVEGRDLPEDGSVLVGWDVGEDPQRQVERPAFHVVAMTGLVTSEARRFDWDTQVVTSEQDALSTALTQNPDDHALLVPGETYTVAVSWRAASLKQDERPSGGPSSWTHTQTDSYRFTADGPAEAPKDLGPWVLTSSPGHGDVGVLCDEPIRIVLATQNVAALFDAYGQELRVLVHAASGKHPQPPGGGTAPHVSIPIGPSPLLSVAKELWVQTPWETAVREVLLDERRPCVDTRGEGSRHLVLTLPYDLEPLTDYLLDVHAVPKGSPDSERNLVHRIAFTTSAFGRLDQLATMLRGARWRHAPLPDRGPLDDLPPDPTGDQLDAAFQAAGLDVPRTPAEPLVQVLWSQDLVPVPLAVVVECTEAMWRSRLVPTLVQAPVDAVDPTHQWWAARPGFWMELQESTAPSALARAEVTKIVRGPGLARAVVLLEPDSRGKRLALDLVLPADPLAETAATRVLAVDVPLTRAPWEEEL